MNAMTMESSPSSTPVEAAIKAENQAKSTARSDSLSDLRQRSMQRAATFSPGRDGSAEGLRPKVSSLRRRRSSVFTDTSLDDGRSIHSSLTDSLLLPRATGDEDDFHQERSHWESLPLLFAIVPAVGGVFFKDGSSLATDFSLLALAAIYLNWCLRSPWDWYHSAQTIKTDDSAQLDTIFEEGGDEDEEVTEEDAAATLEAKAEAENLRQAADNKPTEPTDAEAAARELRIHELCALASCFIGPLFGAYLLHVVRSKLSSHLVGEGLVTNIHLTLFVLCAEIRPARYLIKMIQARTLHLQRLVRIGANPPERIDRETVISLLKRVDELETSIADSTVRDASSSETQTVETAERLKKVQNGLQAQIDPLNRAVRRYEKRTTAQAIQLEARLQSLEARLREALSLAAVAASHSQQSSVLTPALSGLGKLILLPLHAVLAAIAYPFAVLNSILDKIMQRLHLAHPPRHRVAPSAKSSRLSTRHSTSTERAQAKAVKR